jgi:hypothetical protein
MAFNARCRHFQRYLEIFGLKASTGQGNGSLGTVYHLRGERLVVREGAAPPKWPYRLDDATRGLGPARLIERYMGDVVASFGDPTAPDWRIEPLLAYDELSFGAFLRSRGASDEAVEWIRRTTWFGEGIERGSALATLIAEFALAHEADPFQVIDGGNDQLPRAMARALRQRIHYGTPVRSIVAKESGVEVVCASPGAGGSRSFHAERVVSSLPLPALGRVDVQPALPAPIREAVSGLHYLPVLRIFAQMRRQYWREQSIAGPAITDLPIGQVQQHPLTQPGGRDDRAILEAHLRGDQVAPVATLSEPERLELLLAGLEKVHPGARAHYEGGVTQTWADDQWSGGGFSWFAPGQVTRWLAGLTRPFGRIHFAGEHTSALRATMEGALASGVRAAREVHEALERR